MDDGVDGQLADQTEAEFGNPWRCSPSSYCRARFYDGGKAQVDEISGERMKNESKVKGTIYQLEGSLVAGAPRFRPWWVA